MITDLSIVAIPARHCTEIRLQEVPRPIPLDAAQVVAFPQVREPPHARPEGVMPR